MKKLWQKIVAWFEGLQSPNPAPTPFPPDPDVPEETPPIPPPRVWKRENVWSRALPWKTMFARDAGDGNTVLVSTYNRDSRHNSELHIVRGAKADSALHRGDEETLGDVSLTRFIAAERGAHTYKFENGKLSATACKLTGDTRHCVTGCIWRGRPIVAAGYADKNPAIIYDAETGAKLGQAPIKGLIAQMCEDEEGVLWLACVEGKKVLSFDGAKWNQHNAVPNPASVAYWPGRGIIVGSQVDGRIYDIAGRELADLKCSKVNRLLAVDDGTVLVAGSNPDTFAILHPGSSLEILHKFDDEKQAVSGEQFDAGINPSTRGILAWRSHAKGTEAWRFVLSILALGFVLLGAVGCSTANTKLSSPPGYEMDTTPETDGEDWL